VVDIPTQSKSLSQKLHGDSITFETDIPEKVLFEPFIGISPRRYRDIFEKKTRKDKSGKAKKWYEAARRRWSKTEAQPTLRTRSRLYSLP
jgi:hypothetical protein